MTEVIEVSGSWEVKVIEALIQSGWDCLYGGWRSKRVGVEALRVLADDAGPGMSCVRLAGGRRGNHDVTTLELSASRGGSFRAQERDMSGEEHRW